jgi:small subunit ribosomal protein S3
MGQKVNPIGMRLGVVKTWDSRWFADKNYSDILHKDIKMRKYLQEKYSGAGISKVVIERPSSRANIDIYAARTGVLIGKGGTMIEEIKKKLEEIAGVGVGVNIVSVRRPELDARLVADGIASQLEKRVSYRRAMKKAIQSAMKSGAVGIKVACSGRLGGAEIARAEWYKEGRIPLHTLRSDIDFSVGVAKTTYGTCGIKVWICKGECEIGNYTQREKVV